ncbi:hypothetical protein IFM89_019311 [Coptis chinensis]|uniref:Uncharacterized protein n=1 Tax=Coptis chinensis TaxID=261450 RepID=A0A835ICD0_9MAGN|nr:hypothetical protein IFM89_019311 [Coptis chinensis]
MFVHRISQLRFPYAKRKTENGVFGSWPGFSVGLNWSWMEAIELHLPAAVEVSGFGRDGVLAKEGGRLIAKDHVFGRFPVTRGSTSSSDKTCRVTVSEHNPVSRNKKPDGLCMFHTSLPNYADETTAPHNAKPLFTSKQLQRKTGKALKNSSFSSKRPRSEHGRQGSISQLVMSDCNAITGKHKTGLTEGTFAEKYPVVGQKHSLDGKRGDKRNYRPPTKTKVDPFFSKAAVVNSSLSAGGGSILGIMIALGIFVSGIYGLKSGNHDVTEHVDELSLNDLLDGSYKYLGLCQDKAKKAANTNENLVNTLKKACSILQPWRTVQSQNAGELGSSCNRKVDALSSGSSVASRTDCTVRDNHIGDLALSSKDTCTELKSSPIYQPEDILERLALPPAKDLDALLLDTSNSKQPLLRSMTDLRLSKPMSFGDSLPPFSWSHYSNGPSRSTIDAGKLSSDRSRWARLGNMVSSLGDAPKHIDLDYLSCDDKNSIKSSEAITSHNPVQLSQNCLGSFDWQLKFGLPVENLLRAPKAEGEFRYPENDLVLAGPSLNHQEFERKRNSTECSVGANDQNQWRLHTPEKLVHAGHSPRLMTAAQTLYDIARHSTAGQDTRELRWPKKPSQKAMKARKPRSTGKTEGLSGIQRLPLGRNTVEITDKTLPSKRPKYSNNRKMDISRTNHVGRAPIKWAIPTSSRSPPSKSETVEAKQSSSGSVKPLGVMPSYKHVLDKTCDSELRKTVLLDWGGRGRSKNEC